MRRGVGDQAWELALAGDGAALERAAESFDEYDAHRMRAFALALGGRTDDALDELNEGWADDWPFPAAYAVDVARVRYLCGDYEASLWALRLAARSGRRADPAVASLARACVRRSPRLWRRGLAVTLAVLR